MNGSRRIRLVAFLIGVSVARVGAAFEEETPLEPSQVAPEVDDEEADHFEITMGFIAGARDYSNESFGRTGGGDGMVGLSRLAEGFEGKPYDYLTTLGLRYDLRLVVSHVRMTVGMDFPFAYYKQSDTRRTVDLDGQPTDVLVQKIRPYELRFGIGGEYTFGKITPFIDLVGEVDWVSTQLAAGGETISYKANSFGFSVRGGLRMFLREWFFISVAGDYGIVGNKVWDAELSLGFSFG